MLCFRSAAAPEAHRLRQPKSLMAIEGNSHEPIFILPEYERAQFKFFSDAVGKMMAAKDELYGSIPTAEPSEVLPVTQNTMPSGEVVQSQPLLVEAAVVFKWDDIRDCNLDALAEQVNKAAEERLAKIMPHFFDVLHRITDAAGTAADAGGRPFSFELYLEALERMEIQFDREGNPILPTLVMHPVMAEQLRSLPPMTQEQQRAMDDLIERKRTEFNASRRHRKLY
jgi:hypothetical protein